MHRTHRLGLSTLPVLCVFALGCGDAGPRGEQGPPGPGGDSSISAITPGKVFLARQTDVTLSGYNTAWTDAATVDFGADITVVTKTLASPTAIVATIEIGEKAAPGPRDVTVSEGGVTVTYKGAFKLEPPLEVNLQGTQAQGSILIGKAMQLDLSTPFDLTTTGDGFFEPLVYTNLHVAAPMGIVGDVSDAGLYSADFILFTNLDATTGMVNLAVDSGPFGGALRSPAPGAADIAARQPVALVPETAVSGTVDAPFASHLFTYTPSGAGKILSLEVVPDSIDATPGIAVLGSSGKFSDLIKYDPAPKIVTTSAEPLYFVYWDNTGASGYGFDMTLKEATTSEMEPNNLCAEAQALTTLPALLENLALASSTDVDWFAVDVTDADVGKAIRVITSPGEDETDTVVDVVATNCTTSLGGPSGDTDYHENFLSNVIQAPGKFYVKVSNSKAGYTGALYNLSIAFE
jgi:hypothetical protein